MKYPSAYSAVKKLFVAEILSIAVALIAFVAAVLAAVGINYPEVLISAGTMGLVSAIAMIVVFVLQLVAMIQGGRDEDNFRTALWVTLIAIAASLTSSVLQMIEATKGLTTLISILQAFANVAHVIVIVLVLYGIAHLVANLGNHELEEKGRRLALYVVLLFAVSTLFNLFPGFFTNKELPQFVTVMFAVFAIVAAIIELLVYINILIYYRRAIRTLKK